MGKSPYFLHYLLLQGIKDNGNLHFIFPLELTVHSIMGGGGRW